MGKSIFNGAHEGWQDFNGPRGGLKFHLRKIAFFVFMHFCGLRAIFCHQQSASSCAPLPELMDRKKRDIMERKGDKEDENKRQKQQKESSAAAL